MSIGQWLLAISFLLIATHFLRRWSEAVLLSASVVMVLCGVLFSLLIGWLNIDTQLRWSGLSSLILQLLLPMMVFAGACRLNRQSLLEQSRLCLYLSFPGLALGVIVCAGILYLSLTLFSSIAFEVALIAAFILAASDPFCLSGYFQRHNSTAANLRALEKESVLTDAIVVIGYTFLTLRFTGSINDWDGAQLAVFFVGNLFGEFCIGLGCAALAWNIVSRNKNPMHRQLIGIACALLALGLAQQWLVTGGLLSAFMTGLACGDAEKINPDQKERIVLSELIEYLCAILILALLGLSFTVEMFQQHWLAMLCAGVATLVARVVVVASVPPSWLGSVERRWIFLGYSQCAIPAAIALSLPTGIESWYLLQSMVYGVAVMTLLLRGPALALSLNLRMKARQ